MGLRSLVFREFKLSKKIIIVQVALLLSFMALVWGMVLSQDDVAEMLDAVTLMIMLEAMLPVLMDENFKSDINSGWLNYSYALPIKPLTRVAVRFIHRFSVTFGNILVSLINGAVLYAFAGKSFGVDRIVWYIVILAMVTMFFLPNELFLLRARSAAEMKKMQTWAGLTSFALVVAVIVGIFIANGVTLESFADEERAIDLPVFTASSLLWAVPLLVVMIAISFFAEYLSLGSPYPNAVKFKKSDNKAAEVIAVKPQTVSAKKTDGAVGLLYKELKQNRLVIIFAVLTPIFFTLFPFCFTVIDTVANHKGVEGHFEMAANPFIRVLMFTAGFFMISGLISEVFKGDDKKLWAYFVVSTPQGVKGFIYRKYVITLMISIIYMASGFFADHLLATMNYFATGTELETSLSSAYLINVYMLMFASAFDIPFTLRFGAQRGSILKMTVLTLLCAGGVAIYSLLPDEIGMKITEAVISFFKGESDASLPLIIACLLPYLAFAAFLLSYKISCKAYMKGVNELAK